MEKHTRSYTVKNNKKSPKQLDASINQKNIIKEELESSKEYLSDTQEDLINEEDSDNKSVSTFQYYFEAIITIILFFHSFFIYSYLNIIHVVYCFLLTYSRYDIDYTFLVKNKKTLMIVLIIIDSIYLVIKSIFFIIFSLENNLSENLESVYQFFVVGYEWRNYYEYVMVFIIIILFLVNIIIGDFDYNFWKSSILPKTYQILQKESISENSTLNFGLFYISLGSALYPSAVNLAILLIGFLFFLSLLLKNNFRIIMKKYTSIIMIFTLPIYTILNYMFNSEAIIDKISNSVTRTIFINIFDIFKDDEESEYLIGEVIYTGLFPFLFFIKGFNEINFYLKCSKYIEYKKKNKENDNYMKKVVNVSRKRHDSIISAFNEDDNSLFFNKNEKLLSLNEPINDDNSKNRLQGIFNENIDCGIIIFTKETSDFDLWTKIKMFLFKFCYTPSFILHVCRLGIIIWIYCYVTYASIIFIIWLFLSIKFSRENFFFIITKIIVFPLLILIFIVSYISNLKGSSLDSQFLGLTYYTSSTERFLMSEVFSSVFG